jgi:hypothetical protein
MRSKSKLVCGVGVNDADYECVKTKCAFYIKWKSMLERVYVERCLVKRPGYRKATVCAEWLIFSNFKKWMESQDWQGKHLDKDLLGDGTMYSPNHCVFVDPRVNAFINEHSMANGAWPVGVTKRERSKLKKFEAHCNEFCDGLKTRKKFLGSFLTPEEAHQAWKAEKHKQATLLASMQADERVKQALLTRYA